MKKFLCALLTVVMLFALSGCNSEEKIGEYDNVPPIMMVLENRYYEGYAGLTNQVVTVLDSEGKYHYLKIDPTENDPIDFSGEKLYEQLLDIAKNEDSGREPLSKKELCRFRWNVQYFEKWSGFSKAECGFMSDYDRCNKLYGVYYDSNEVPQIIWLAETSSTFKCCNDTETAEFVNSTGLLPFKLTLRGD